MDRQTILMKEHEAEICKLKEKYENETKELKGELFNASNVIHLQKKTIANLSEVLNGIIKMQEGK